MDKREVYGIIDAAGEELAALGQGGLCLDCETCTFPNCGFGKGM